MSNPSVVKYALHQEDFSKILKFFTDPETAWYFQEKMIPTAENDDRGFFSHHIFRDSRINSPSYDLILPLLEKLNAGPLIEIRANFVTRSDYPYECVYHNDCNYTDAKTAIFYLTRNNGYTQFDNEEKTKIYCEPNKLIVFDCKLKHKMISQTDANRRLLINLNYLEK